MSAHFDLDRVPSKRDWAPILVTVIIAGFSLIVSGFTAYTRNDSQTTSRISVVETQQQNDASRLNRIELKLDQVDAKLDRVLERR
jgi:hypothetical protein